MTRLTKTSLILTSLIGANLLGSLPALAESITVDHLMGSTTVESQPKRVVVIGIGALDVANALNIEPVAVSKGSTTPDYLTKYASDDFASSGTIFEPNFEAIYSAKPDLIIVGPRSSKHFDELSKIAPTYVFAIERGSDYWSNVQNLWRDLGKIFDKQAFVDQKIAALDKRFHAIKDYNQSHDQDALMLMSSGGNVTSFGEGSRFAIIYDDFGFKPTIDLKENPKKSGSHGQLVSYELVSQHNPSTLLILDRDKLVNKDKSTTRQDFDNDLVKSTDAYKNGRMVYLDIPAWYVASAGMTATETMIEDIESLTTSQ